MSKRPANRKKIQLPAGKPAARSRPLTADAPKPGPRRAHEERLMPDEKGKHRTPSFVDDIVKDPKEPPQTLLLQGYPGAAADDGDTRLYLDPALSSYVDVPKDAVLHT